VRQKEISQSPKKRGRLLRSIEMTLATGLIWEDGNRALHARFPSSHYPNGSIVTSKELAACPDHSGTETCLACTIAYTPVARFASEASKAGFCLIVRFSAPYTNLSLVSKGEIYYELSFHFEASFSGAWNYQ